jgi:exosortase
MSDEATRAVPKLALPWATLCLFTFWGWAIWACAEHWQGNPNYSYGWAVPVLALFFGIRRYLSLREELAGRPPQSTPGGPIAFAAPIGLGGFIFLLEYAREQMWHPQIVLWTICLLTVVATLAIFWLRGGRHLAKEEAFPVLFFLTAVPWPPRLEQPITSALMRWVAAVTTELLHWLGIEAQSAGGAIALRSGLVGITEACSGIRSLQAGVMFGLAMGEWFLLRPARRVALLCIAILLALATNLMRTFALALQAEWHGAESVDRVHDLIGNIMITALILGIWMAGKILSGRAPANIPAAWGARLQRLRQNLVAPASAVFAVLALATLAGIFSAHSLYARAEARDRTQTRARFVARVDESSGNRLAPVPREVTNELRPTSGEYIRHEDPALPGGGGDCFHFFWKPSAWNRFALVHRPDICMPGIGWKPSGPAEPVDIEVDGHAVRFYLFRFHRGNTHALELWGAWRNGEAVPLEYSLEQVFGTMPPPVSMQLEGKRRSATEIVACSVIADGVPPTREMAVALLNSVFHYKSDE